ncbi:MAG: hypothetical protein HZC36_15095 [Armatimonadetes bacterium]|nr:hypothetical protein [Armatimonadota bacterium]
MPNLNRAIIAALLLALGCLSQGARFKAGTIAEIKGGVELKRPGGAVVRLKQSNRGMLLFSGDLVRCALGGKLVVTCRTGKKKTFLPQPIWQKVPVLLTSAEEDLWVLLTGGNDPAKAAVKAAVKRKGGRAPEALDASQASCGYFTILPPEWAVGTYSLRILAVFDGSAKSGEAVFSDTVSAKGPFMSAALSKRLEGLRAAYPDIALLLEAKLLNGERAISRPVALMAKSSEDAMLADFRRRTSRGNDLLAELELIRSLESNGLKETAAHKLKELKGVFGS